MIEGGEFFWEGWSANNFREGGVALEVACEQTVNKKG
jgi:hypothetical protein